MRLNKKNSQSISLNIQGIKAKPAFFPIEKQQVILQSIVQATAAKLVI